MSPDEEKYMPQGSPTGGSMDITMSEDSTPSSATGSEFHSHSDSSPSTRPPSCSIEESTNRFKAQSTLRQILAVVGALISLLFSFGHMNAFGTYQTWYSTHQLRHIPPSSISLIGSLQLWVFFLSGAPIGFLFDAYGPRWLMLIGAACYVHSLLLTSFCTQYYQYIIAQGLLFGLSLGLLFYPPIACLSLLFDKYRSTAVGIAAAGSSLGGVIYPIVLRLLFDKIGFKWGIRTVALISGAGCLLSVFLIPSTSRPATRVILPPLSRQSGRGRSSATFVFLTLGSCFLVLGLFIPSFYIVDYSQQHGIPENKAIYVLAVMNAGGMVGRIAPAYLSDIVGRLNLLIPSAFLSATACVSFWPFARSLPSIMTFAAIYGFFSGAYISLITPCIAQVSDMKEIGRQIGILYSAVSMFALIGGPLAGKLLTTYNGEFLPVIYFSGISIMIGCMIIFYARMCFTPQVFVKV